jgi:hypothetical protein
MEPNDSTHPPNRPFVGLRNRLKTQTRLCRRPMNNEYRNVKYGRNEWAEEGFGVPDDRFPFRLKRQKVWQASLSGPSFILTELSFLVSLYLLETIGPRANQEPEGLDVQITVSFCFPRMRFLRVGLLPITTEGCRPKKQPLKVSSKSRPNRRRIAAESDETRNA